MVLTRSIFRAASLSFVLLLLAVVLSSPGEAATKLVPGDEAFVHMDYESALSAYGHALEQNPAQPEVLWRMARLYICLGDLAPEERQRDYYLRAEEYARSSVVLDSTLAAGHTWLAAALGSMAMDGGAKEKVQLSREIKRELDRAILLDPEDDAAYSMLGSFYRALGNVSWIERRLAGIFLGGLPAGGYEEAEQALLKAISLNPNVFRHYYELGRLYADWGRPEEAIRAFNKAVEIGPVMSADRVRLSRAREEVVRLKNEE
jgi:tetratricopeptide (TPR) repeat protein